MNLEQQVASLELCKKLKSLRVIQGSLFYWHNGKLACPDFQEYNIVPSNWIAAFTAGELGEMLPSSVNDYYWRYETNWYESTIQYKDDQQHIIAEENDKSEANARAKCLIMLIENGLMPLPDAPEKE